MKFWQSEYFHSKKKYCWYSSCVFSYTNPNVRYKIYWDINRRELLSWEKCMVLARGGVVDSSVSWQSGNMMVEAYYACFRHRPTNCHFVFRWIIFTKNISFAKISPKKVCDWCEKHFSKLYLVAKKRGGLSKMSADCQQGRGSFEKCQVTVSRGRGDCQFWHQLIYGWPLSCAEVLFLIYLLDLQFEHV